MVRQRLHADTDPLTVRVAAASHDDAMPSLWVGEEEVLTWPRGEVPPHSVFAYLCTHPECAQAGTEPFICHRGDPPQGIERRGLEFLQEPGTCGHKVERRLLARGADAILGYLSGWKDQYGRRLLRG